MIQNIYLYMNISRERNYKNKQNRNSRARKYDDYIKTEIFTKWFKNRLEQAEPQFMEYRKSINKREDVV